MLDFDCKVTLLGHPMLSDLNGLGSLAGSYVDFGLPGGNPFLCITRVC